MKRFFVFGISAAALAALSPGPGYARSGDEQLADQLERLKDAQGGGVAGVAPGIKARFRIKADGTTETKNCRLDEATFRLPEGYRLDSLQLPSNDRLKVIGVTLVSDTGLSVPLNLTEQFSVDGLGNPGEKNPGDFDGRGASFPAGAVAHARTRYRTPGPGLFVAESGTPYLRPPLEPGAKNVLVAAGQQLAVPVGEFSSVRVLLASTRGANPFPVTLHLTSPKGETTIVERRVELTDWCKAKGKGAEEKQGTLEELAKVLRTMADGYRVPVASLECRMSPGAVAANTGAVRAGYTWSGEKTETTFTATVDVAALFPGEDLTRSRIVAYVGIDDKGAVRVNDGPWHDFYWDDGRATLSENTTPTAPVRLEIYGKNETGTGKLLRAEVGVEIPAIAELATLVENVQAFQFLAKGNAEGEKLARIGLDAVAANVPVEALAGKDLPAIQAATARLRADLKPLSAFAKARHIHLIGYSHIDLAWLWPLTETIDSVIPLTFNQALKFMDEFPDFTFSMTQAQQYAWVEKTNPAMFQEIQRRVKAGQWEMLGGMWCEPDCNLPSGESFVRQVLYGKRYFRDKFGVDVRVAMNPDSFGYNWQLPQIYRKSGFDAFITQKISWNDTWHFPYNLFWWEAPDQSRLLAYFPTGGYGEQVIHDVTARQMNQFEKQTSGIQEMMVIYGVGDHGGGPTRAMIQRGKAMAASPVLPETSMTTAQKYVDTLREKGIVGEPKPARPAQAAQGEARASTGPELPVWKNELYLEKHRGTYTTHHDIKDMNRRSERLLYGAELAASLAWLGRDREVSGGGALLVGDSDLRREAMAAASGPSADYPSTPSKELHPALISNLPEETTYPARLLDRAWQDTCLLQMHDILPGSSIRNVYADAARISNDLRTSISRSLVDNLELLSGGGKGAEAESGAVRTVYNLLPWERTGVVLVKPPAGAPVALSEDGKPLPQQRSPEDPERVYVQVQVPAGGYRTIRFGKGEEAAPVRRPGDTLENQWVKVRLDRKTGNLASVIEKATGREMLGEYTTSSRVIEMPVTKKESFSDSHLTPAGAGLQGNILQVHGDYPATYDAWDIGLTGRMDELSTAAEVSELTSGPVFDEITVKKPYGTSFFQQTFRLYHALPWVDVLNEIEWNERHAMVKAAFPLSVHNTRANYEIPFGAIDRPTVRTTPEEIGKYEHAGIQWGNLDDVSGAAGLALLTMDKYGFDAKDNVLRLSLLRAPDVHGNSYEKGEIPIDKGHHRFSYAILPHKGTWQEADVVRRGYEYNHPLVPVASGGSKAGAKERSLVRLEPSNVMLSSLKKAEDDDSVIVRVYEAEGADTAEAALSLPWPVAGVECCDLMEQTGTAAAREQRPARAEGTTLRFPLGKYEVATYKVRLR